MYFPFHRHEPSRGSNLRRFALLPVTALLFALTGGFPAGATGDNPVVPEGDNPDLEACGIDFALILDRSGSIKNAGAEELVQDSARAFLDALKDLGSTASLVTFAGTATPDVNPVLLTQASIDASFEPAIAGLTFDGATNWQAALKTAREQSLLPAPGGFPDLRPDLVVMITDGNPTVNNGNSGTGDQTDGNDLPFAVVEADAIKAGGTHMFAVGVGGTTEAPLSEPNLMAISGPDKFEATTPPDMTTADWTRVTTFEALQERLVAVAASLCSGSVIIEKLLDEEPASGWTFDATGDPAPAPSSATTGDDGTTGFSYTFQRAEDEPVATTITERAEPGAAFVSASCMDNSKEGDDKKVGTVNGEGMDVEVGPGQSIKCTFNNATVQGTDELVPGIEISKSGPALAHEGDKVTYDFTVTNTGETVLEDIVVTDDLLGDIGTVPSLEPGESETLKKEYTVPAGQVANVVNVGKACATAETCDEDDHVLDVLHPAVDIDKTVDSGNPANRSLVGVPGSATFSYTVRNIGDTPLLDLAVIDSRIDGAIGATGVLGVNESRTFTKVVNIPNMDYPDTNRGTVNAADALGRPVTDFDDVQISLAEVLGVVLTQPATLPRTGSGSATNLALAAAGLAVLGIGLRRVSRRSEDAA